MQLDRPERCISMMAYTKFRSHGLREINPGVMFLSISSWSEYLVSQKLILCGNQFSNGRRGTVAQDGAIISVLASGAESQPATLVNDVDGEKGPAHFAYTSSLRHLRPFSTSKPSMGCRCKGGCQPGDINCPCIEKNGGVLPYTSSGVLSDKSLIHECGRSCTCPPTCRNRISQAGLKTRLEVFKTKTRGWGLRSWDPICAGGYICEYAGDIIQASSSSDFDDNHIFDATRYYEPFEAVSDDSRTHLANSSVLTSMLLSHEWRRMYLYLQNLHHKFLNLRGSFTNLWQFCGGFDNKLH